MSAAIGDSLEDLRRAYGHEVNASDYRPDLYAPSYDFEKDGAKITATILPNRVSQISVRFFEKKPREELSALLERYSGAKGWTSAPTTDPRFARHFPVYDPKRNSFFVANGLVALVQSGLRVAKLVLLIQSENYPDLARDYRREKSRNAVKRIETTPEARANLRDELQLAPEQDVFLDVALQQFNQKLERMNRDWGFLDFERWEFDQFSGVLRLKISDGSQVEADCQAIGSYWPKRQSWEWSWNNPNIEDTQKIDARRVREFGTKARWRNLDVPMFSVPDEQVATCLSAMAIHVIGSEGVFAGRHDELVIFLSLKNLRRTAATK